MPLYFTLQEYQIHPKTIKSQTIGRNWDEVNLPYSQLIFRRKKELSSGKIRQPQGILVNETGARISMAFETPVLLLNAFEFRPYYFRSIGPEKFAYTEALFGENFPASFSSKAIEEILEEENSSVPFFRYTRFHFISDARIYSISVHQAQAADVKANLDLAFYRMAEKQKT